jgi:monofunctional biosynthetic peptidoglycan transglycosylase
MTVQEPSTIVDFHEDGGPEWRPVNDTVMGGESSCSLERTEEGTGLFTGDLSLENNGGFASVRAVLGPTDLSAYHGLRVRVRGDGRRYRLRLRTDDGFDGVAYQAKFPTEAGEWTEAELPFSGFGPTFRGRTLPGFAPLDPARITQIAFMVADGQEGSFRLEIDSVRGYGSGDRK